MNLEHLFKKLHGIYPELVEFRRDLHMYPELSFEEINTPKKIADYLIGLGLEVRTGVGSRGVVGYLKGGRPGKTVALRADFDALPIQDEKNVSYKSRVPGVMHACGHDIHTAALLGVAKVLSEVKNEIQGNVVFIHQFAEEKIPGGAKSMIEDGCLDGVDVIYGAHVWAPEPIGTVGVGEGPMMASMDSFEIEIIGKGGHGATPHATVDSLVVGSQLVLNLQQIVSRRVDPLKPAVVTVGTFESGEAFNVIPGSANITGTVRSFDESVRGLIEDSIGQIAAATCEGAGATAKYDFIRGYPAVLNDAAETRKVENIARKIVGEDKVKKLAPIMAGEDFSYYLQKVPGSFFFVGGGNPQIQATYPHHNSRFDVDEQAMLIIGKLFISLVSENLAPGNLESISSKERELSQK
ncbi:M20 metallopeptidase family protein [Peribacillus glennii]|uniref:Amidohydrolase n=1 Tax=Peribacillus glennii TaxID=2303991 RepID=A0A372LJJ7_9BACI|nr:M20 family metallopeptidase [Peribacillus glennii]RFU66618.1 amidohydrolase [Peribacillus glennii]